jgi:hypothetical protein
MTTSTTPVPRSYTPDAETTSVTDRSKPSGPVRLDKSLVDRACLGDASALNAILRQFIGTEETIEWCDYLGTYGVQPFGRKSFAVLTPRRIGALQIGWLGFVFYQDAPLEFVVSAAIAQPSKLALYVWLTINTLLVLVGDFLLFSGVVRPGSILGVVALLVMALVLAIAWVFTVRFYYAVKKCGLLWAVREGLWVYAFTNRGRMNTANRLLRLAFDQRALRVQEVGT